MGGVAVTINGAVAFPVSQQPAESVEPCKFLVVQWKAAIPVSQAWYERGTMYLLSPGSCTKGGWEAPIMYASKQLFLCSAVLPLKSQLIFYTHHPIEHIDCQFVAMHQ